MELLTCLMHHPSESIELYSFGDTAIYVFACSLHTCDMKPYCFYCSFQGFRALTLPCNLINDKILELKLSRRSSTDVDREEGIMEIA